MRKLSLILIPVVLVLGACGDDDGGGGSADLSAEDQAFVDAAMETFDAEEAAPLTEDDGRCIVESMVSAVGADRLEELGITAESFGEDDSPFPEGLERDEAEDVVDGINGCIDMAELFLEGMAEDDSMSDEAKECLADAFDQDFINDIFVTMLSEGEDALETNEELTGRLFEALGACPEAITG